MKWEILQFIDVVLLSKDDLIGFEDKLSLITHHAKVVVMTDGGDGATVYYNGQSFHFPSYPVKEVDPTGAGDIFATTFLYYYSEHQDIAMAAAYAHSAASYVVEGYGIQLPSKKEIEDRFKLYINKFSIESID